jgi:hypothetical protein
MWTIRLALISLIGLALFGCGSSSTAPKDLIIGTWKSEDGKESCEFTPDGTWLHRNKNGQLKRGYRLLDNETIEFTDPEDGDKWVRKIWVSKNALTLTDAKGQHDRYER